MMNDTLLSIFERLRDHFGPQNWWPGETPFEMMVGAILTQSTNWGNVEKALTMLKDVGMLRLEKIAAMPTDLLAEYIRPAGYYNIKAARIHNLCTTIMEYEDGTVEGFLQQPVSSLRKRLLTVKGIGPETADAIMLYGAHLPVFVVDTYTHRILNRHQLVADEIGYDELQEVFMDNLEEDVQLFNEYHALLVCTGKKYCRKTNPDCANCPLEGV